MDFPQILALAVILVAVVVAVIMQDKIRKGG